MGMGNNQRLAATVVIWLAVMMIGIAAMGFDVRPDALAWVTTVFVIGAATSTRSIWRGARSPDPVQVEMEKAKRHGKIDRLMERLNDDDVAELRARLDGDSDGEAVSLDELMRRDRN
jgi:hypothetical protein